MHGHVDSAMSREVRSTDACGMLSFELYGIERVGLGQGLVVREPRIGAGWS